MAVRMHTDNTEKKTHVFLWRRNLSSRLSTIPNPRNGLSQPRWTENTDGYLLEYSVNDIKRKAVLH